MRFAKFALLGALLLSTTGCYTTPSGRRPGLWFAMYPVNRALDLADMVSVAAGPGLGLYADVHATRGFQFGGGGGVAILAGWWRPREFSLRTGGVSGIFLGPVSYANLDFARGAALGAEADEYRLRGRNSRTDPVYAEQGMDYWAVGGRAMLVAFAVSLDIHPVEVADALLGFIFIDLMEDDIGNRAMPAATEVDTAPVPVE